MRLLTLSLVLLTAPFSPACVKRGPVAPTSEASETRRASARDDATHIPIDAHTSLFLVDVERGRELIGRRDRFVANLSDLDRRIRMGTTEPVSEADLLAHFQAQVRPFQPEHAEHMRRAAEVIAQHLAREKINLRLPPEIPVVLTSGHEEAGDRVGVAYTREGVIYLNERALTEPPTYLLSHELFHVYSHHHPVEREELYEAIGFRRLKGPVVWPPSVEARRVTNPDSPQTEHAILVRYEGHEVLAAYVCLLDEDIDDPTTLFDRVSTYYAVLNANGTNATRPGDDVVLANYHHLEGFFEQVGYNTGYLAGPEEILADNFELLLQNPERARTPALLTRLRQVMTR